MTACLSHIQVCHDHLFKATIVCRSFAIRLFSIKRSHAFAEKGVRKEETDKQREKERAVLRKLFWFSLSLISLDCYLRVVGRSGPPTRQSGEFARPPAKTAPPVATMPILSPPLHTALLKTRALTHLVQSGP